jgi:hypothetical protein
MLTSRTASFIIGAALVIGVVADQLLHAPLWGINLPIAAALLAAAGMAVPAEEGRPHWTWLASVFFASMWVVRDAETLLAWDLLAALALASLPLLRERGITLLAVDLIELGISPLRTAWAVTFGTFDFVQALRSRMLPAPAGSRAHARAIGAGVLLATPLVLVFGSLFASADPVFDRAVSSVFSGTLAPLVSHAVVASALAWATAGYLWALAKPPRLATESLLRIPEIGGPQVLTPLIATVSLFAIFIAVQATSLFGGAGFVETTTGLTFAEYARRGFFQLVFASALVLPLLYFAPVLAGPLDREGRALLKGLLAVQLGLTGLVLASALWRMALYIQVYGLTEDRLNGTAIMLWIAGTLGVFACTVVRERPRHAAFGSLIAAVVALAALNLANPQALIARFNLANQNGREIDFDHLARLGGDAVPILVSRIEQVPADSRCRLVSELKERYGTSTTDWRGWNLARARAHDAVSQLKPAHPCPSP